MSTGRHRRLSRGDLSLTAEQLAVISVVGLMAAMCSVIVDVVGVFDAGALVVVISPAPKEATTTTAAITGHLLTQELARRLYTTQLELD